MADKPGIRLFIPVLLLAASWVTWTAFQTAQMIQERNNLETVLKNQEQTVGNAQKLRAQLDAIAAGVKRLADSGNANARRVIEELARQGITVNPQAATGQASGSP